MSALASIGTALLSSQPQPPLRARAPADYAPPHSLQTHRAVAGRPGGPTSARARPHADAPVREALMRSLIVKLLTAGACLGLASVAVAEAIEQGKLLPEPVKDILWTKACDLTPTDWRVKCKDNTDPKLCQFRNSKGEPIQPLAGASASASILARFSLPWTAIAPTLEEAGLPPLEDASVTDETEVAFRRLAGIPVQTQDSAKNWGALVTVSPAAVDWALRELVPAPDRPMCGQTAKALYDAGFRDSVRVTADAYTFLKGKGLLKNVTTAALDEANNVRKGKYFQACQSFAKAQKRKKVEPYLADGECRFWLRRAAAGQADLIAGAMGLVLEKYDPTFFKKNKRHFARK